jgi:hypothetical protein
MPGVGVDTVGSVDGVRRGAGLGLAVGEAQAATARQITTKSVIDAAARRRPDGRGFGARSTPINSPSAGNDLACSPPTAAPARQEPVFSSQRRVDRGRGQLIARAASI